jgi:hypothetical protein
MTEPVALVAPAAVGPRRDNGRRRQAELAGEPPEHLALLGGLVVDGDVERRWSGELDDVTECADAVVAVDPVAVPRGALHTGGFPAPETVDEPRPARDADPAESPNRGRTGQGGKQPLGLEEVAAAGVPRFGRGGLVDPGTIGLPIEGGAGGEDAPVRHRLLSRQGLE